MRETYPLINEFNRSAALDETFSLIKTKSIRIDLSHFIHKTSSIFTQELFLCFVPQQYNIKKKEELVEAAPQEEPNPLMRKKKTPEELAAEAEQEDLDDFTSKF